jgi:hypothetical protein
MRKHDANWLIKRNVVRIQPKHAADPLLQQLLGVSDKLDPNSVMIPPRNGS